MRPGSPAIIGYGLVGSHGLRHRTEHRNPVEAASQLYLAFGAAGRLLAPSEESQPLTDVQLRMAWAA